MSQVPLYPEDTRFVDIEKRLVALERAARLPLSSIGEGGLRVKDGGKIQYVAADGTVILEEDAAAFTYFRADGSRQLEITPAGGLKIYDTDGLAELVVLSSAGLAINGIVQPALSVLTAADTSAPTIGTSYATINEIIFSIPTWADEVSIVTIARLQYSNLTGAAQSYDNRLINDVGGLDEITDDNNSIPHNETDSSTVALSTTVSTPGSTITCRQQAQRTSTGTHAAEARLEGLAIIRRTS